MSFFERQKSKATEVKLSTATRRDHSQQFQVSLSTSVHTARGSLRLRQEIQTSWLENFINTWIQPWMGRFEFLF